MMYPVAPVGMPWFHRGTFGEFRAMLEDGHRLPLTYDEWLLAAEAERERQEAKGIRVVRVYLDHDEFPLWCKAKGLKLDAKSSQQFATWVAYGIACGYRAE